VKETKHFRTTVFTQQVTLDVTWDGSNSYICLLNQMLCHQNLFCHMTKSLWLINSTAETVKQDGDHNILMALWLA
jgi:hypothetical protein